MSGLRRATAIALALYFVRPLVRALPLRPLFFLARILAIPLAPLSPIAWWLTASGLLRLGPRMLAIGYLHSAGTLEKQIVRYSSERLVDVPSLVSLVGGDRLQQARQSGRGLILVTIHSPVIRLLHHWVNQADPNWRPYLIRQLRDRTAGLESRRLWLLQGQQARVFDGRLIDVDLGLRQAVRVLRDGGTVLITQDEVLPAAPLVRFLGREARNPLGAARLAAMTDALILPVVVVPSFGPRRWVVHFWPAIDPRVGGTRESLLCALETIFTTYPQAWEWRTLQMLRRKA